MTARRPLRAHRVLPLLTAAEMLRWKRTMRRGGMPGASPAMVAEADRVEAAYRERRDEILQAMQEAEGRAVNIAAGLVAVMDPDPEVRDRALVLLAHAEARRNERGNHD